MIEECDGTTRIEQRQFGAFQRDRRALAKWAADLHPDEVVMESTGIYWKSPYAALEAVGIYAKVVNARYKEIFPAPAKTDAIDARRILELFQLSERLPLAKNALQGIAPTPLENDKVKRLTRRRKQLVAERVRVVNRLQADLHAVCPGLRTITGEADNLWFLNFLTCRDELPKLAKLHHTTLLAIPGVGRNYAAKIQAWQPLAQFASEIEWVGEMILQDAHRILALNNEIKLLDQKNSRHSGAFGTSTKYWQHPWVWQNLDGRISRRNWHP